jgi:DNA invertase Pin-like site-specific DNA recombinase
MKYGYARVSSIDQNPALQIAALNKAKCAHIFKDKLTGANTNRPQLSRCLKTLRPGDTLVVWKLDRLGRSLHDLIAMLYDSGLKILRVLYGVPETRAYRTGLQRKSVASEEQSARVGRDTFFGYCLRRASNGKLRGPMTRT